MKVSLGRAFRAAALAIWSRLRILWEHLSAKTRCILEEIGETTGILAVRLVANPSYHWTERVLWFSLIVLSVFSSYLLSSTQLRRYIDSPTVVSLDRDYRGWKGTMPAITLCYYDNLDMHKANAYIQSTWNVSIADEEYFYFMEFLYAIVNSSASNYVDLARFAEDDRFEEVDLTEAVGAVYRSFDQMFVSFNPWFKISVNPVMTERGRCYAINSPISAMLADKIEGFVWVVFRQGSPLNKILNRVKPTEEYDEPLICEFGKQQCFIKMDTFESTGTIDVHSAYEVSESDANVIALHKSDEVIVSYKSTETVASDKLRELTPKQRKCVFRDEETSELPIYAKTLCLARCRAAMALEMCNCVPFFYPYVEGPSCNPAGFECLLDFKWPLWALHICNCPSTCTEVEFTPQSIKRRSWGGTDVTKEDVTSTFRWEVSPPKVRYHRDVVFSFEDLLVSFGGTLALFLGFSVLSIVQIVNVLVYNGCDDIWTTTCCILRICWNAFKDPIARFRARNGVNASPETIKTSIKKEKSKINYSIAPFPYLE